MDITTAFISIFASCIIVSLVTGVIVWLIGLVRSKAREQALILRATQAEATLDAAKLTFPVQATALEDTEMRMREAFESLSSAALQSNREQFVQLAQEKLEHQQQLAKSDMALHKQQMNALIDPLKLTLDEQRKHLREIELARTESYGKLDGLLGQMKDDQLRVQKETANLVMALRQPTVRGRWGELTLRRVVELAGMSVHCDFCEQQTGDDGEGGIQRPDLIIRLPNRRQIVVDSKVPLDAYLQSLEATDDEVRTAKLKHHAKQVREHIKTMNLRSYHTHFEGSHDFTILFIPGEVFYNAALEHDGDLLEYALGKNIILANPSTLIALFKAVALGWREAGLAEDAHKVKDAGEELYKRMRTLAEHIDQVGKHLEGSVTAYNKAVGSLQSSLLPSAQRMHKLQISAEPITEPRAIEQTVRTITKPELMRAE